METRQHQVLRMKNLQGRPVSKPTLNTQGLLRSERPTPNRYDSSFYIPELLLLYHLVFADCVCACAQEVDARFCVQTSGRESSSNHRRSEQSSGRSNRSTGKAASLLADHSVADSAGRARSWQEVCFEVLLKVQRNKFHFKRRGAACPESPSMHVLMR